MIIDYTKGRPGSGKTFKLTKRMAKTPAKYLYAVDRIEVFKDRRQLILGFSKSKRVKVVELNSDISDTVRQDIKDAPDVYASEKHIVVIVSHEALMTSDLSHYAGWHLFIDEIPNAWVYSEVQTKESKELLAKYFSIRKPRGCPSEKRFNKITVKENVEVDSLANDTYAKDLMALYKPAKNGNAYCAIDSFTDADKWDWWSVWDVMELEVFASVCVVANAFEDSLTFKIMQSLGVQFKEFQIPEFSEYRARKLIIKYFDDHNRATSYFFSSPLGRDALSAVGRYLAKHPVDIWSCNHSKKRINYSKLLRIKGHKLNPCVAGSNDYSKYTSAAFIYSAKPSKTEIARLSGMGIAFEDVVRSREVEPAIQFVTRLSNRNPNDDRDNIFYVYDRIQAQAIKEFFDKLGIAILADLEFVDLGIPVVISSAEEKRAKRAAHDKVMYERKKAKKLLALEANKPA